MVANFSPRKIGLKFVTENFTTFSTARKEICHLELTLGASSPKGCLGRGGGLFVVPTGNHENHGNQENHEMNSDNPL